MVETLDLILLFLIFIGYGVGDVATTLYGMKRYSIPESNPIVVWLLGENFTWYESIGAKLITLILVIVIYYISRIDNSSKLYAYLWWLIAIAIIFRGFWVTMSNWKEIQNEKNTQ